MRALRAQISPHFIYNSLTAIASFVRTDPERARELLLEFADFTRYSFRRHGEFTTLAEELRSIERYLAARAGPVRRPAAGDRCRSPPRCCRWRCRSSASSRWSRTPSGTASRAGPAHGHDHDRRPRPRPRGASSRSRTTASARTPSGSAAPSPGDADGDSRRARQRRRAAAPGLRRRLRPGRRDRAGRRHQGDACGSRSSPRGCTHERRTREPAARCACSSSTTSAPALDELAFLLGRDAGSAQVPTAATRHRGAAAAPGAASVDARLPRHPDAGPDGLELARVLARFDPAAGRLRHGARRARRRRLRPRRRRLRPQAGARRAARRGGAPGRRVARAR